jgi:hypothetical protein
MTEWVALGIAVVALLVCLVAFSRARGAGTRADKAVKAASSAKAIAADAQAAAANAQRAATEAQRAATDAQRAAGEAQRAMSDAVRVASDAARRVEVLEQRVVDNVPARVTWRIDTIAHGRFRLVNTGRFTAIHVAVTDLDVEAGRFVKIYAYPDLKPGAHMDFDVVERAVDPLAEVRVAWSDVSQEGNQSVIVDLPRN